MKDSSVTKIPCTIDKFFNYWLSFLAPLHKLSKRDIDIFAVILKKRYELSRVIVDDTTIDSYLFTREIKNQIIEELNIPSANFNVTLSKLRSYNIIIKENKVDKINKKFIPNLSPSSNRFDLLFLFNIENNDR